MLEYVHDYWTYIGEPNQTGLKVLGIVLALGCVTYAVEKWKGGSAKREKKMLRKQEVKLIMTEEIQDMLLDLHTRDLLTAREVNQLHEKFAKQFGYWDLYPRKLLQEKPELEIVESIGKETPHRTEVTDSWYLQTGSLLKQS